MGGQTIRVQIAYDGTRFAGYARQPGQRTVEGILRERLAPWIPDLRRLAVGGRTDRGVHGAGQVVSFHTRRSVDLAQLARAIAPDDEDALAVLDIRRVSNRFDAQRSARARRYAYFWTDDRDFRLRPCLQRLLLPLVGRHDFGAFARDTPKGSSTTKRLIEANVYEGALDDRPALRFELVGEGFLRRQVRVLVATALREARAEAPDDRLADLLREGHRRQTAPPAPPEGLYLTKIIY